KSLLKKLYKEQQVDVKQFSIKSMMNYISSYKTAFVTPEKAMKLAGDLPGEKQKALIYGAYEQYNKEHNMLDFDDLLIKTLTLFRDNPQVVKKWSRRYQYVHVDEFQDVGEIEYELIHYFGQDSTVCVVGDPDQTIYSFRGSDVNYIMNFDKDYQNVKTIILDQNYRSTKNILEISNNLIRKNKNRLEKDLFSNLEDGPHIIHFSGRSEEAEAEFIGDEIEQAMNKDANLHYSDIAILYRANYLSRPIEQMMIRKKIPYRIFGGLKFFNRKEVKDALSYLRLLVNNDDLSFERIVNVPGRGVGAKTLEKIQLAAIHHQLSDYETLCFYSDEIGLSSKVKKSLKQFVSALEKARVSTKPLEDVYDDLMKDVGYYEMLQHDQEDSRMDNLMELKNSIASYVKENPENATLESYLQDIALYTTQDEGTTGDYVSMMSIHMAKGLEFKYVFVAGLSENIFPSIRSIEEGGDDGLEEERRLAYVAFTRAKEKLYLTDSQGFSFVSHSPKMTSRFVDEIGKHNVEHVGAKNPFKTSTYINTNESIEEMIGDNHVDEWKVGDLVMHDTFGKGVVVNVRDKTLDIAFSVPYGLKTLMAGHKALKRLTN
ncbi:MAG TPA: ATP-dependent DNA helicase, partial [Erysipelotrichaceae bacterium]|nr:ATP-dependent DNA helicase [Erysipelotrichaceae bacterium]